MTPQRAAASLIAVLVAASTLVACSAASQIVLPPAGAGPDYQLGGSYPPPPGVEIVARDRTQPPAPDVYSICYVNGFQTQPGELGLWPDDTLLHDFAGEPVFDPFWPDEALLDTSTPESRAAIVEVVEPWIRGCADAGFDAVEFDNLDTYARTDGALGIEDNLALAEAFVDVAHENGLAAAQKNAAEHSAALHEDAGFDFAVAEECAAYDECELYTEVYGVNVIAIEYADHPDLDFDAVCRESDTPPSIVLRDRQLALPGDADYVFALCP
ncbi:endo alpha-1,4 polygalactosaminidase [Microbacterium sulfonylureivorans]|uniref:endo alpha-1,4 polygalactosaminidase n=1 Tax=Microbacterium sulfonylureivorans TaxID=2486854 RepID=UPI000FD88FA7|nr:endo alpha-1,4 polygalactosaminidase [Microbacterium sulfonylureivorans]